MLALPFGLVGMFAALYTFTGANDRHTELAEAAAFGVSAMAGIGCFLVALLVLLALLWPRVNRFVDRRLLLRKKAA